MIPFDKRQDIINRINLTEDVNMVRAEIIKAINDMDNEKELEGVLAAVVRPAIAKMVDEIWKQRKITQGDVQGSKDAFIAQVLKTSGSNSEKIEFVQKMGAGELYDSKGTATNKKPHKLTSYTKENNNIFKQLLPWFVGWAPKIAGQAVGGGEAFLILNDPQGDNSQKGDAYLGGGYNIEVKTSDGAAGESNHYPQGLSKFVELMNKHGVQMSAQKARDEEWMLPIKGGGSGLSKALNRCSHTLSNMGVTDNEIASLYGQVCAAVMKGYTYDFSPCVKNGKTVPNIFKRIWTAAAIDFYKSTQGFDYIYVLDINTLNAISYSSGSDFLNTPIDTDNAMSWNGSGSYGGTASPRLLMRKETKIPVEIPNDKTSENLALLKKIIDTVPNAGNSSGRITNFWKALGFKSIPKGWNKKGDKKEWKPVVARIKKIVADIEKTTLLQKDHKAILDNFYREVEN